MLTAGIETLAAYERWAPLYPPTAHNPLMRAEECGMRALWPSVAGRRTLDLASGSGRYSRLLAEGGAELVVAVDFCMPMLRQVADATPVCGSMMRLPFAAASFDVIVSGLALGHASGVEEWMSEVSRVLRPGGTLLYSDFHPRAADAGLTRSFKDRHQQTCNVPHRNFSPARQRDAAAAAGLHIDRLDEIRVGIELTECFAHSEGFYRQWHGLPIVLVASASK